VPKSLPHPVVANARRLRRAMTLPEVLLWQQLRLRPDGHKFRRQHPIGPYIVDFYCAALSLAVEVDGAIHDQSAAIVHDARRDAFLKQHGVRIVRLSAADVLRNPIAMADSTVAWAAIPLHQPMAGPPPHALHGEDHAGD